jgi:hypothetical protein
MTRKDFLKTSSIGFLAGIFYLSKVGCKGTPTSPDISGIDQKVFTSSSTNGHTHTVIISQSEIENTPAGGISRQVSLSDGHTHTFSMTQAELLLVKNGNVVEVFDSEVSNHSHRYRIEKWY